jgi:hypothetical protein
MSDLDFMGNDFDPKAAHDAGGGGDFDPLPPGWYYGRITEIEVQNTKAGNGKMVYARLDIEGPKLAGRVVFDRMVVAHPNPTAVEIGRARFGGLCLAAGFEKRPNDTKALLGKVVGVKVKTEKSKEYGDKSVPQDYRAHAAGAGAADPGAAAAAQFDDADIPF